MTTTEALDLIDTNHLEEQGTVLNQQQEDEIAVEQYFTHSIYAYLDWFYDGEQCEFDRY